VVETIAPTSAHTAKFDVDFLASENTQILLIEGHVSLNEAVIAMAEEGNDGFPAPEHGWKRYVAVPEGEFADRLGGSVRSER